jgi:hypothetical protein
MLVGEVRIPNWIPVIVQNVKLNREIKVKFKNTGDPCHDIFHYLFNFYYISVYKFFLVEH